MTQDERLIKVEMTTDRLSDEFDDIKSLVKDLHEDMIKRNTYTCVIVKVVKLTLFVIAGTVGFFGLDKAQNVLNWLSHTK